MLPTLRPGDLLLIRAPGKHTPDVGDLVLVDLPERGIAVKRLVEVTSNGLWVERDNPREGIDSWAVGAVSPRALRGIVTLRMWPRPAWY